MESYPQPLRDLYHSVVSKVLQGCTQPQVLALAHVEGLDNRIALASATPVCKHEIRVMLRLFNTLEIVNQRPAYTNPLSDTQIFYALRYPPPAHLSDNAFTVLHEDSGENRMYGDVESMDDAATVQSNMSMRSQRSALSMRSQHTVDEKLRQIHREKGQQVIAKLTSRSDVVERELKMRKSYRLSRNYVPVIFSVHHTVQHAAYSEAMAEPGYCITMEGADATAENYMLDVRNAGMCVATKSLKKIGIALMHMHERNLVHGDFGSHNVGKFGKSKWKLLGIGGSYQIGDMTDPRRGFYNPPEAIDEMKAMKAAKGRSGGGFFRKGSLGSQSNSNVIVNCVISTVAHPTFDIWAYGNVLYESFVGSPLSPYICRGKRPMGANDYAKLGKWSDSRLTKALEKLETDAKNHTKEEIELVKDLLTRIFVRKPNERIQTMRMVLEHPFFSRVASRSKRGIPQAGK